MDSLRVIVADSREPPAYITKLRDVAKSAGLSVATQKLDTGDYLFEGAEGRTVCIERKTVSDLLSSITDGRWQGQLPRLQQFDIPILLVEGVLVPAGVLVQGKSGFLKGWTWNGVDNLLLTAQSLGIHLARCDAGPAAVSHRLVSIFEYSQKTTHDSLIPKRSKQPTTLLNTNEQFVLALLTGLPQCGPPTARKMLMTYGSMSAVFGAINAGPIDGVRESTRLLWRDVLNYEKDLAA